MKNTSYRDLLDTIKEKKIKVNFKELETAYQFAKKAHQGQKRYSGDAFITHPLCVANTIASWGLGETSIKAALLHDVLEDTPVTYSQLQKNFGHKVAFLVQGVTKTGQVKLRNSQDHIFVENLKKMFVSMAKDIRVVLIRLADRHHNMLTLGAVPKSKQKRIALETLEVYAPLAERLGMGQVKGELEDLAFFFTHPKSYQKVDKLFKSQVKQTSAHIDQVIKQLTQFFKKNKIKVEVHGRFKNKYSLYHKLKRPSINYDINSIYDLVAIRVITSNLEDCYLCLGHIHQLFKPVPHLGLSDFISQPKPNGYQSIHTKVFDQHGGVIEVQIRSIAMHQQAEFGAAAHHVYSQVKFSGVDTSQLSTKVKFKLNKKTAWIHQLTQWQKQVTDTKEFKKHLSLDTLSHRIYVFSPLGDVFDLPEEATPVDFAFAVHSDMGLRIQRAKVNQKLVSLDHPLQSGDIVEIEKTKKPRMPNRHWLQFVKSSQAKSHIKKALKI
jgi:GTP diphosphokinase / guanosine-3',5'-bis(diphosphate) 3'-diphosphatase